MGKQPPATKEAAWTAFEIDQQAALDKGAADGSPDAAKAKKSYAEWKVLAYADAIAERPKEAEGLQRKLDAWTARRDDARKAVKS